MTPVLQKRTSCLLEHLCWLRETGNKIIKFMPSGEDKVKGRRATDPAAAEGRGGIDTCACLKRPRELGS
jgi:hypothetical protein